MRGYRPGPGLMAGGGAALVGGSLRGGTPWGGLSTLRRGQLAAAAHQQQQLQQQQQQGDPFVPGAAYSMSPRAAHSASAFAAGHMSGSAEDVHSSVQLADDVDWMSAMEEFYWPSLSVVQQPPSPFPAIVDSEHASDGCSERTAEAEERGSSACAWLSCCAGEGPPSAAQPPQAWLSRVAPTAAAAPSHAGGGGLVAGVHDSVHSQQVRSPGGGGGGRGRSASSAPPPPSAGGLTVCGGGWWSRSAQEQRRRRRQSAAAAAAQAEAVVAKRAKLLGEIEVLMSLRHPNIVTIMGAIVEDGHDPVLVVEHLARGAARV